MTKKTIKKGVGITVILLLIGLMILFVQAAPMNTPGRIALDMGNDFQEVSRSGGGKRSFSAKDGGAAYKLECHTNLFSDANHDGMTFRTKNKYDMTDVEYIEFAGNTMMAPQLTHKFLVYADEGEKITYDSWAHDDVTDSAMANRGSDGTYFYESDFTTKNNQIYSTKFKRARAKLTPGYAYKYIYFGVNNMDGPRGAGQTSEIKLNNRTYQGEDRDESSFALVLKEHKVGAIAPNKIKVIAKADEDSASEYDIQNGIIKEVSPAVEITFQGNNSSQEISTTSTNTLSVYRDDPIVMKYTANMSNMILKAFEIYSDKEGRNKIFTVDAGYYEGTDSSFKTYDGSIPATLKFNSTLIQRIEKQIGKGASGLNNFYIKPVFEVKTCAITFPDYAANSEQQVLIMPASRYIPFSENDYLLIDKEGFDWIGRFNVNDAKYIGDQLIIDYKENTLYKGSFKLDRCNIFGGDSLNSMILREYFYPNNETIVDYSEPLRFKAIEINPQVKALAKLELKDDTDNVYNGDEQTIDPVEATYPLKEKKPSGLNKITYEYFYDKACTQPVKGIDKGPVNAGVYYVVATMPGDDNYAVSKSNVAKFEIQKAKPKVTAQGSQITYGYSLGHSELTGRAVSEVTNQTITGTYRWINPGKSLPVGYHEEQFEFIPDDSWGNYDSVQGQARMSVKAASVTLTCDSKTAVYCGEPIPMDGAKATYVDEFGNVLDTNQEITYTYYRNVKELDGPPTDAGEYKVKVSVPSGGNFNGKTLKDVPLHITPAKASLVQVPVNYQFYRVYFSGAVDVPKGTVKLEFSNGQEAMTAPLQIVDGEVYAEFSYVDVKGRATDTITASYIEDGNYEVLDNVVDFEEGAFLEKAVKEFTYVAGNTEGYSCDWKTDFFGEGAVFPESYEMKWRAQKTDVAEYAIAGETISIIPENVGVSYAAGLYKVIEDGREVTTYLLYKTIVSPTSVTVSLADIDRIYTGEGQSVSGAVVTGPAGETVDTTCTYRYYNEESQAIAGEPARDTLPTDVGTYYVRIDSAATRNYNAGYGIAKLQILPAETSLIVQNKTVTYTGKPVLYEESDVTIQRMESLSSDTITFTYVDENGEAVLEPVNAGTYQVTAHVAANGNYAEASATGTLVIEKQEGILRINGVEEEYEGQQYTFVSKVYDGQPQELSISFVDKDGNPLDPADAGMTVQYRYKEQPEAEPFFEPPVNAGIYLVQAVVEETQNYKASYSNEALLWIQKAPAKVTLPEKIELEYTGEAVALDCAEVSSNGEMLTEAYEVVYTYYYDRACTEPVEGLVGGPVNAGIYYVTADISGTNNYEATTKDVAQLVIKKAIPIVTAQASPISYGYTLGNSVLTGTAISGITNEVIPGTYRWCHPKEKLTVGEYKENFEFIPDAAWSNYDSVVGSTIVYVQPAEVTIACDGKIEAYCGKPVSLSGATVTYTEENGEAFTTQQEITYTYYQNGEMLAGPPTEVGDYTVNLSVVAEDNFAGNVLENVPLKITPVKASLVQIPVSTEVYRVYFSGAVDVPKGQIKLEFANGMEAMTAPLQCVDGEVYAEFSYPVVKERVTDKVTASYIEDANYEVMENVAEFEEGAFLKKVEKAFTYVAGNETTYAYDWKTDFFEEDQVFPDAYAMRWIAQQNDVAEYTLAGETISITPKNAGVTYAAGCYKTMEDGKEVTYHLLYKTVVSKADVTVSLEDAETIYNGDKQGVDGAVVTGPAGEPVDTNLTYRYYEKKAQAIAGKEETAILPVEAGTYYVRVDAEGTRNYNPGYAVATLQILPAETHVKIEDKTATYTGKPIVYEESDAELWGREAENVNTITYTYTDENGENVPEPVNVGTYQVTVHVAADRNYEEASAQAILKIEKASVEVILPKEMEVTYTGKAIPLDCAKVLAGENDLTKQSEISYFYYKDEACTQPIEGLEAGPEELGVYYVKAYVAASNNWDEAESNVMKLTITKKPSSDTNPAGDGKNKPGVKTGDTQNVLVYYVLMLCSAITAIWMLFLKRRSR